MFEKLKDIKNQMKMVNDLKNMVGDVDMKNPSKMFEKLGINVSAPKIDVKKLLANKNEIVTGLTGGIAGLFKKNKITS